MAHYLEESGNVPQAPRILIVEDQVDTAEMLTSYFEAQGYEVTSVGWGKDALAFTERITPDLVMLDIRLPDIDGYEVYRHLRGQRRTEHVPVIFLTDRRKRGDRLLGLGLGAADFITKPFDVQELRLRVRNVLRRSKLGRLSHPITGLPASPLLDKRLEELMSCSGWAELSVGMHGLDGFAEAYGFVARDDVMRAVAVIVGHVVMENCNDDAFVGHLDDTNFCIVIMSGGTEDVRQALKLRLNEALAFFYPRADWEAKWKDGSAKVPDIDVAVGVLEASACSCDNLTDLRQAILEVQRPG